MLEAMESFKHLNIEQCIFLTFIVRLNVPIDYIFCPIHNIQLPVKKLAKHVWLLNNIVCDIRITTAYMNSKICVQPTEIGISVPSYLAVRLKCH